MPITQYLEYNADNYGEEISLVEINPGAEETPRWKDFSLTQPMGYSFRREISWRGMDYRANRMAKLLYKKSNGQLLL